MNIRKYISASYIKSLLRKRITGCAGLALSITPLYFYAVDGYQSEVMNLWSSVQAEYAWGSFSLFLSLLGIYILSINLSSRKNDNRLIYLLSLFLIGILGVFGTWIYIDEYYAYYGIILFIPSVSILFYGLITFGIKLTELYNKLEPYERLAIAIPLITVLLSAALK